MNRSKITYDGRLTFWNDKKCPPSGTAEPTAKAAETGGFRVFTEGENTPKDGDRSLGLSHVAISDKQHYPVNRRIRGAGGITSHGRYLIRSGCQKLEDDFGLKNLTFLTCTLPDEAIEACDRQKWSVLVNRFLKLLRYHLGKAGLSTEIVGCIEIQEKRMQHTNGVPPLHLHLLFQGRKRYSQWQFPPSFYQELWERASKTVFRVQCSFRSSCRAERLHSSGVGYMSKYMSKGGKSLSLISPQLLPSAWYTISNKLKAFIKGSVLLLTNYAASTFYRDIKLGNDLLWAREIRTPEYEDGSSILLAWMGQIRGREKYWEIISPQNLQKYRNTEIVNFG